MCTKAMSNSSPNVSILALALFSIADQRSRKSPNQYGVLTGLIDSGIKVHDAHEFRFDGAVDLEHLTKHLALTKVVGQQSTIVGLYSQAPIPQVVWDQFEGHDIPIYLVSGDEPKVFDAITKEEIAYTLVTDGSIQTTASTLQNHPLYSHEDAELTSDSPAATQHSLELLEEKIKEILEKKGDHEFDRKIVHLATKLRNFKDDGSDETSVLLALELALMTNELTAVDTLRRNLHAKRHRMGRDSEMGANGMPF